MTDATTDTQSRLRPDGRMFRLLWNAYVRRRAERRQLRIAANLDDDQRHDIGLTPRGARPFPVHTLW